MKLGTLSKLFSAAVLSLTLLSGGAVRAAGTSDCADIPTDKGKVTGSGVEKEKLCIYKGIPFAAPPVGDLRFAQPREHAPWTDTFKADKYGNECLQTAMGLIPSDKPSGAEDCLYLNVTAPIGASGNPVMVFIHGGGFITGSGSMDLYRGTGLPASGGIVLVTINYRLGAFGFMAHKSFREDGVSGNYGIYDQVAALKWVKKNIKNFGGDPDNITIFGESAGGMSVGVLLTSPAANGLFKRAILQSGPAIILNQKMEGAEKLGQSAAENLGCKDTDTAAKCLRALTAEQILKGAPTSIFFLASNESKASFPFSPAADGKLIPNLPYVSFATGKYNNKADVMLGSNSDEASFFLLSKKLKTEADFKETLESDAKTMGKALDMTLDTSTVSSLYPLSAFDSPKKAYSDLFTDMAFTCTNRALADMLHAGGTKNTYLYYFSKKPVKGGMFKDWGAFHGVELAFIYDRFEFMGVKFASAENSEVAKKVIALWSSFARTGVPEGPGLPKWKPFDPASAPYIHIDVDITTGENLRTEKCKYFGGVFKQAFGK